MSKYIVDDKTVRPFRLYNPKTKKYLRWRCFKHVQRAHLGALMDIRWAKTGDMIEVVDVSIGRLHGSYMRNAHDIKFYRGAL